MWYITRGKKRSLRHPFGLRVWKVVTYGTIQANPKKYGGWKMITGPFETYQEAVDWAWWVLGVRI
jgi:hypothetical protein